MRLISWNVNGLRACIGKGFLDVFRELESVSASDCAAFAAEHLKPEQLAMSVVRPLGGKEADHA